MKYTATTVESDLHMHKKLVLTAFLMASVLVGLSACADHKMPPSTPNGNVGSPNYPQGFTPASQGVPG